MEGASGGGRGEERAANGVIGRRRAAVEKKTLCWIIFSSWRFTENHWVFYTSAPNTPKSPDLDFNCIEREKEGEGDDGGGK